MDERRRSFLLLVSLAVCAGLASTVAAAAFRFLRPQAAASVGEPASSLWNTVAPAAELTNDSPQMRKVSFEQIAGWSSRRAERAVFVLPSGNDKQQPRVVSAICPHEGCEVEWRTVERDFFCPCHDSRFAPDGVRLSGPARHGLEELPARVENGLLQVQFPAGATSPEEDRLQARA